MPEKFRLLGKKDRAPMPPWLKWGLAAFIAYAVLVGARNPHLPGTDWSVLDSSRYQPMLTGTDAPVPAPSSGGSAQ